MSIGSIGIADQNSATNMAFAMRVALSAVKKNADTVLASSDAAVSKSQATTQSASVAAPKNMVADLFVHTNEEQSKYTQAIMATFKIDNKLQNSERETANNLLDQLKAYSTLGSSMPYGFEQSEYLQAGKDRRLAERLANQDKSAKTLDSHGKLLNEMNEDREAAAEEALASEPTTNAAATAALETSPSAGSDSAAQVDTSSATKATEAPAALAESINIVV